jgi:outer membrane protein, multidrug efflux system
MRFVILSLFLSLSLAACAAGPTFVSPRQDGGDWYSPGADTGEVEVMWWKGFNDPLLDSLIDEAVTHNHDIRIAKANVQEARALRTQARAGFFPEIGASAQRERTVRSKDSAGSRGSTDYDASLDVLWELDIFGKTRRSSESALANLQAEEEAQRGVVLSVISETAASYFEARGLQRRIDLLKKNIGLLKKTEDIAQSRFKNGVVSELDVLRARGEREELEAILPSLEAAMMGTVFRVSVLTGNRPEHHVEAMLKAKNFSLPRDRVPVGLRSDVLRRRPDVQAAERNLARSSADIGVAEADLFPSLSLTGSVSSGAARFGDLFSAGSLAFAAGQLIDWAVFSGWQRQAAVEAAKARNEAAFARYEKTVLTALEEAERQLVAYGKAWKRLKQLRTAGGSRSESHRIARLRYESGTEDFLSMIDAERSVISVQDDVIESETAVLLRLTSLYKALGGGWEATEIKRPAKKPKKK